MSDQAEKLRNIVNNMRISDKTLEQTKKTGSARVITITSGKGGVGKTNITVNLAIALSKMGLRVVILDVDFGLANIDVLMGMSTKYTMVDLVRGERNIFEVLTDGPNNVKFLSGGSGVEELLQLDRRQLGNFINNISLLDKLYDVILIDTGAGLSRNVMSFIHAADEVVLITTPEPTAITDAYAVVKMISRKDRHKVIKIIVNKAETPKEAYDILSKLMLVSERFLAFKLQKLGYILYDDYVTKAVKQQKPFYLSYPKCHATQQITELAVNLFEGSKGSDSVASRGMKGFFSRLLNAFGGS
ncbi:MAG: MinD/ParA family protein [Clostridiaceae bacterium]|jgi:flagellar biosynthesis protein FlhG|nr:MinD/ParA family protein [Clostridiaceae bacterium]